MVFILEMIFLKNKGWGVCDKPREYADVGTHCIALFCRRSEIVYFDSFGVEHVPEEIKEFIGNKNIKVTFFEYNQTINNVWVLLHRIH